MWVKTQCSTHRQKILGHTAHAHARARCSNAIDLKNTINMRDQWDYEFIVANLEMIMQVMYMLGVSCFYHMNIMYL